MLNHLLLSVNYICKTMYILPTVNADNQYSNVKFPLCFIPRNRVVLTLHAPFSYHLPLFDRWSVSQCLVLYQFWSKDDSCRLQSQRIFHIKGLKEVGELKKFNTGNVFCQRMWILCLHMFMSIFTISFKNTAEVSLYFVRSAEECIPVL